MIPNVGGGVGFDDLVAQTARLMGPDGYPTFTQLGGQGVFAAITGEAGLNLALAQGWSLASSYRFEHVGFGGDTHLFRNANLFRLGLRYAF